MGQGHEPRPVRPHLIGEVAPAPQLEDVDGEIAGHTPIHITLSANALLVLVPLDFAADEEARPPARPALHPAGVNQGAGRSVS